LNEKAPPELVALSNRRRTQCLCNLVLHQSNGEFKMRVKLI
jgi:hypothetical protein